MRIIASHLARLVWGVALMISGGLISLAVWRYGPARLRAEVATESDWTLPRIWDFWIRYAIPLQAIVLLVWWLRQATTEAFAADWWNPLEPYSAASCLLQWGIVLVVLMLLNKWIVSRLDLTQTSDS